MSDRKFYILLLIGILPFFINDLYNPFLEGFLFWFFDTVVFIVIPLVIYCILIRTKYISTNELGLTYVVEKRVGKFGNIFLFIFCLFVFPTIALLLLLISQVFFHSLFPINYLQNSFSYYSRIPQESPILQDGAKRLIATIYMSIIAGVTEEFYYRALLYKFFDRLFSGTKKIAAYLLLSSLIFGLIHWSDGIVNICATFVFGFVFALFYYKTRNIIVLMVSHFFVDLVIYSGLL